MKIYIFVDMEGISGVSGSEYVLDTGRLYQAGRRYYTWDINACVEGCFAAGATEVVVRDGHSSGNHALWEELDPRVQIIQGVDPARRLPGLDGADGMILLGYHAMAGTLDALLEHTFSSRTIQNMWLNGRLVGEIGIDAAIATEQGVPTIMVSGDDKACHEAAAWLPGVVTCQVKEGLGCQCARLLPRATAHRLITDKTAEAVGNIGQITPMAIERPVTLRREMVERTPIAREGTHPGVHIIDGRTTEVTADSVEAAFRRL